MLNLLLVSPDRESFFCENEAECLEIAKENLFFTYPGDKICLIDFNTNTSTIFEMGDDLIATCF